MSRHPVTPMAEADLRQHLSRQGMMSVASLDYTAYDLAPEALEAKVDRLVGTSPDAVLFDVGHPSHLPVVGRVLWQRASVAAPLLAFGPSSVAQALIAHWRAMELSGNPVAADHGDETAFGIGSRVPRPAVGPVLVVAGSLSGVTARQRAHARSYVQVAVDAARLMEGGTAAVAPAVGEIVAHLAAGRHVLAHTAAAGESRHPPAADARLARATGELLRLLLTRVPLRRIGIAGGDTSSYAVKALDCWGLSYLGAVAPGSALCRLHAASASLDGLEVMLKGGQMGTPDVFERLLGAG
jgi:3-oxoisoapionate kinase